MDPNELRSQGRVVLDHMATYWESLRSRPPLPAVQPGYLQQMIPKEAPLKAEKWEDVMKDVDRVIMPGVTHWQSPQFHAYFPTGNSVPSMCAEIVSSAISCIGFSWISSPACTELEMAMMKWLGKMIGLPEFFYEGTNGGGIIQSTASEGTLLAMLSARSKAIKHKKVKDPNQMVVYFSEESHSSVERAAMILQFQGKKIKTDAKYSMCAESLKKQVEEDLKSGLTPIMCVATLGTTACCSFDRLDLLGPICKEYDLWLHVDSAYAGSAFVCPEFRYLMQGIEHVDTYNMNAAKWLQTHFDCSPFWFKDSRYMVETFNVDPLYLQHTNQNVIPDFRHWQIPLGRRFRSLKLWFVMRMYGVEGLRECIRKDIQLAKLFETLVKSDNNFEIFHEVIMGLVCFKLKAGNEATKCLSDGLNKDGRIYLTPAQVKDVFVIRFVVCSTMTEEKDIHFAWQVIKQISHIITT